MTEPCASCGPFVLVPVERLFPRGDSSRRLWNGFNPALILVLGAILSADAGPFGARRIRAVQPRFRGSGSPPVGCEATRGRDARPDRPHARERTRTLAPHLTAEPHVAGTPADHKTAVSSATSSARMGLKADIARR